MADKTLLKAGPFLGIQSAVDPYYIEQPYGAICSNVDVSYRYGAFCSAQGRSIIGTIGGIPDGYVFQCVSPFVSFSGDNPVSVVRILVFSAFNASNPSQTIQGYYTLNKNTTAFFTNCNPFTDAVQFGSALWTNGGNKIILEANDSMVADDWQVQVPANLSYNIFGTYVTQAGNAEVDTYTYAITVRRSLSWTVSGSNVPYSLYPDLDTYQESSPVFTTPVTITSGNQPAISYPSSLMLPVQGQTSGGETYYGALYRSSTQNPTFQFVDYLINLPTGTGHDGNPCFIDTKAYASIQNNAYLTDHHDPPPIIGQVYPGAIVNNSSPSSLVQQQQQQAFTYTNPCFLTKHKNRLWAFTLYPQNAIGSSPVSSRLSLQPQLWCSDEGVPWSFNDDPAENQVLLVGPEDTPGNCVIDSNISTNPPWEPGDVEDTPMGLATTGSILVMLKSQSTWLLAGDTPAEFIPRKGFNIGCISSDSITEAEGGVFWLAAQGVYFFDGGAPEYIGEDVRGIIEDLQWSDQTTCEGSYRDRTFYLSFNNITLAYYVPSKKWYTLPYGADVAIFSPFNQNQLIFVLGTQLQAVDVNPATDLGNPIVSNWVGQLSDSGAPGQLKRYNYLIIRAPQQPGMAMVTLTVDSDVDTQQVYTCTFDLSKGHNAHVAELPQSIQGYTAQLSIQTTTDPSATDPITVDSVVVVGDITGAIKPTQTTDLVTAYLNGSMVWPHV